MKVEWIVEGELALLHGLVSELGRDEAPCIAEAGIGSIFAVPVAGRVFNGQSAAGTWHAQVWNPSPEPALTFIQQFTDFIR